MRFYYVLESRDNALFSRHNFKTANAAKCEMMRAAYFVNAEVGDVWDFSTRTVVISVDFTTLPQYKS